MRICLHTAREVGPEFIGGTERLLIETAKELKTLGHEPYIVSSGLKGEIEIEGVSVIQKLPTSFTKAYLAHGFANSAFVFSEVMGSNADEAGLRALGAYVDAQFKDIDTDVIHLNSFAAALFSESASGAIITNHENQQEYDGRLGNGFTNRFSEIVSKRIGTLHRAALLTTPSNYYANYYSSAFNLPVVPVKAGVGLNSFCRTERRKAEQSRSTQTVQVLLPARFEPFQKGHDIAMQAVRILLAKGFPVVLTVSGMRSDYKERLGEFLSKARSLGIAENVKVKKFADMRTAYHCCDVAISPERYCSYGLAISETLALGIPTVLSDIPTYREIASGYGHARFFLSEDANALAEKIIEASRIHPSVSDPEAIRFRIENDLRAMALKFHDKYLEISQNSTCA